MQKFNFPIQDLGDVLEVDEEISAELLELSAELMECGPEWVIENVEIEGMSLSYNRPWASFEIAIKIKTHSAKHVPNGRYDFE